MIPRFGHLVDTAVGFVLMVCVTAVLAIVIATFILDIGDDMEPKPQGGYTFSEADYEDILLVEETIDLDCIE